MMIKQKFLAIVMVLLLALVFAQPALAQERDDRAVFGQDVFLENGEQLNGDFVLFGGNLTIPISSTINGDVAVFGGTIQVDGEIDGDVAAIGGDVNLSETADVGGDIATLGGRVRVHDDASVSGEVVSAGLFGLNSFGDGWHDEEFEESFGRPSFGEDGPRGDDWRRGGYDDDDDDDGGYRHFDSRGPSFFESVMGFFVGLFRTVMILLALAVISWLVAAFLPDQMAVVQRTLVENPAPSFGVGFLTAIIAPIVGLALVITVCLAPISLLGWTLLLVMALFGWIVIGQMVGDRLLAATGQTGYSDITAAVVGTLVLYLLYEMPILSSIPCLGILFSLIGLLVGVTVASMGLGAVLLTRFGMQPWPPAGGTYRPSRPSPRPSSPAPAADTRDEDNDDSDLGVKSASEDELKAKIKAALAEADAAFQEKMQEDAGKETTPADDDNNPDTPSDDDDDKPDDDKPKTT